MKRYETIPEMKNKPWLHKYLCSSGYTGVRHTSKWMGKRLEGGGLLAKRDCAGAPYSFENNVMYMSPMMGELGPDLQHHQTECMVALLMRFTASRQQVSTSCSLQAPARRHRCPGSQPQAHPTPHSIHSHKPIIHFNISVSVQLTAHLENRPSPRWGCAMGNTPTH
eukprot:5250436-Amphidinium_carterae.1